MQAALRFVPLPHAPLQVKVCAIDSGILTGHEDLAANVAGGWNRMARGANGQGMPLAGTADYLNITGGWGGLLGGGL
jgi:hypothetical protein